MPPRYAEEIREFLRVNGPTPLVDLSTHFAKWGADNEDLRLALEWLVREGRIERTPESAEQYRLRP
ncbi:MAG: FeoC-like transcriptional regulator [Thermoplasmata archaeon]|nr:FeoC-like transcriptional regulator [Thermoplasmata archaeon]